MGGRLATPMLVVLREYGAHKKISPCSILEYLEIISKSIYQISPPLGAIEYLLLNGRIIIIFDGLDELLETNYRQEISGDAETFCNLYPSVPVLVTSRQVGYEQAPLDPQRFEVVRLAPFGEEKTEEYVRKWFAVETDLSDDQRKQKVDSFLKESSIVSDLRSNPLMLALMCNIYRGENYIPQNRPEVYEKCATMLFERWDKSRGIHMPLPFEAHIRPAMMYIAFWVYSHNEYQGGITEESLINKAVEYLAQWRFADLEEARKAAREFVEFCRGRAWVFTDVGTTKSGESLYLFTHRTFLEYFSGAYLARTNETAESLSSALLPRIAKREWDVVAQLAFQIKAKNSEGAGDRLLRFLLEPYQHGTAKVEWNFLSFAARCLEFMVPSPPIVRELVESCLQSYIEWVKLHLDFSTQPREESSPSLLSDILGCSPENQNIVARFIEEYLSRRLEESDEDFAYIALEIGLNLRLGLHGLLRMQPEDKSRIWRSTSRRFYRENLEKIKILSERHLIFSSHLLMEGDLSVEDILERFGTDSLFYHISYKSFSYIRRFSIGQTIIFGITDPRSKEQLSDSIGKAEKLGKIFSARATPFFKGDIELHSRVHRVNDHIQGTDIIALSPDGWFGLAILLGTLIEVNKKESDRIINSLEKITAIDPLVTILKLRMRKTKAKLESALRSMNMLPTQNKIITAWTLRKVSFCAKSM